jgi:SAM-dependent methyltransferase
MTSCVTAAQSTRLRQGFAALASHYEACLARFGPTVQGVDAPDEHDHAKRFAAVLSPLDVRNARPSVLDLGCGPGFMLDYLEQAGLRERVEYLGVDISEHMVRTARDRWPEHAFECRDVLATPFAERSFDYVVLNTVLTERVSVPRDLMEAMAKELVRNAFATARVAVSFNVMNAHVDWTRDDLFHWPFDEVASFLRAEVSRHYAFLADYGLYEYTVVVRHDPIEREPATCRAGWILERGDPRADRQTQ